MRCFTTMLRNLVFGRQAEEYRNIVHDNKNAFHTDAGNIWRGSKHASEVLRSAQGAIDLIEKSRERSSDKTSKIP
jgi:hypothetical protein